MPAEGLEHDARDGGFGCAYSFPDKISYNKEFAKAIATPTTPPTDSTNCGTQPSIHLLRIRRVDIESNCVPNRRASQL